METEVENMASQSTSGRNGLRRIDHVGLISMILTFTGFFCMLNETVLNMALNSMMVEFQVTANTVQWLTTGYMLVMAVSIPVSAFFIQTFKTRSLYAAGVLVFLAGCLLCGVSPNFFLLLIGRLIQAMGTGLLIPNIVNTLVVINPIEKRGRVLGVFNLVMFSAPAIGPTLSGVVVQWLNWRWLFFSIIPFCLVILILGMIYIQNVVDLSKPSLSVSSIVLSTLGFGGLIYGVNNMGNPPVMLSSFAVALIALIAFSRLQFKLKEPMLDLEPFKYPMFSIGVILIILMHMVNFAVMLMLPIMMQGAMGITAFTAGLILLPGGFVNGLLSPVAGMVYDKYGPRFLILPGFVISTVVFFTLSRIVDTSLSIPLLITLHCISLVAVAVINTPCQTHCLNQLPPKLYPHGNAISNTLQQVGGAFGTALFVALMSVGQKNYLFGLTEHHASDHALSLIAGVRYSLSIAVVVLIFAVILAFFMRPIKKERLTVGEEYGTA